MGIKKGKVKKAYKGKLILMVKNPFRIMDEYLWCVAEDVNNYKAEGYFVLSETKDETV